MQKLQKSRAVETYGVAYWKIKKLRRQTPKVFLLLYYRVFTAAHMCVSVKFDIEPLGTVAGCRGSCWVVWYWWLPWGDWKVKGVCAWVGNSCAFKLMTTCDVSAWFTDIQDLSSLLDLWIGQTGCCKYPKHLLRLMMYIFRTALKNVLISVLMSCLVLNVLLFWF